MKHAAIMMAVLLPCAGLAQAGTRADLSGDVVVDFSTTADMPLMTIGDTGNAADGTGYGSVGYDYSIGKFEVTAGQYTEFLNAVAGADTYELYHLDMFYDPPLLPRADGCQIERTGSSGSYAYSVAADYADRPVNYVSWADAARFANWLTNGMPTGLQGLATTEDGSYFLNGATSLADLMAVTREADAVYVVPSEDEWYKAAYYDAGATTYYDYATGSDTLPSNDLIDPDPGNNANFMDPWWDYTLGAPVWRTEVGEFENSESPYGTFDMTGNVSEFTDTAYDANRRIRRGGDYYIDASGMDSGVRRYGQPTQYSFAFGFRIVSLGGAPGDFDGDGDVDADDIDLLCDNLGDAAYDVDGDGDADEDDMIYLIETLVELTDGVRVGTKRGDFNLDGLVNGTDLALMKVAFGQPGQDYADGNANCDAFVNGTDLAILKTNFGFIAPPSPGGVPEPVTIGLLSLGGLAMLRRRRSLRN
ncbi:hypothetical protein LCGC14_0315850 [marine sediment metagenome]|uniref:Sulfatase-modifying factor enzyme-like domain-containing protein n=1 Tax=marine sediment metagenome TaxID=412755 RepID=A0A0F9TR73_9ZZZZ|nr:PEP-CTERM sorting domain-containing protein [Phycisphaerae bacterium]HDZ44129.1 PEP-CTERM sorting domain-containing protein [Phycisphaerae bacterium]